jgi:hypothetical protein
MSSAKTTSSSLWRELRNQRQSACSPRSLFTSRRQPQSETLSAAMPKTRMAIATQAFSIGAGACSL